MLLLTLNMNMFNFVIDDSFNDYFDSISTDIAFIQEVSRSAAYRLLPGADGAGRRRGRPRRQRLPGVFPHKGPV